MSEELSGTGAAENTQSEASTSTANESQSTQTQPTEQTKAEESSQSLLDQASKSSQEQPKEETKTESDQKTEEKSEGAPEKYEDFKAPEGVTLNAEVVKSFSEAAKELNLSQSKAQAMIDKLAPTIAKQQVEQIQALNKSFQEKVMADPVIGGDNWNKSKLSINRGLKEFTNAQGQIVDKDIAEIAAIAGNHPGLLKIFHHFGKLMQEDQGVKGSIGKGGKTVYTAEDFYK